MDFFDVGKWDDGGTPKSLTKELFQKQKAPESRNSSTAKPQQSMKHVTDESLSKKNKKNKKNKPKINTTSEGKVKNGGMLDSFGTNLRNKYKNTSLMKKSDQSPQEEINNKKNKKKRKSVDGAVGSPIKKQKLSDSGVEMDTISGGMPNIKHKKKQVKGYSGMSDKKSSKPHTDSVGGTPGADSQSPGSKKKHKRKKGKKAGNEVSPTASANPVVEVTEDSLATPKRKTKRKKKDPADSSVISAQSSPAFSKDGKEGDSSPAPKKRKKKKKKNRDKNKYKHLIGQKSLTSLSHSNDSLTASDVFAGSKDMQDTTADVHTTKTVTMSQNNHGALKSPLKESNVPEDSVGDAVPKKKKRKRKLSKTDPNPNILVTSETAQTGQIQTHNNTPQNETTGETKKKKKKRKLSNSEGNIDIRTSEVSGQDKTHIKVAKNKARDSSGNSSQLSPLQDKICDKPTSKLKMKASGSPFDISKLKSILDSSKPPLKVKRQPQESEDSESDSPESQSGDEGEDVTSTKKPATPRTLGERMKEQLQGARFRYINQQLYTQSGSDALEMMTEDPDSFHVYHQGFQSQVAKWPENPVDRVIAYIKNMSGKPTVADFGCGDAKIAMALANKVHSFDLVAVNDRIIVCDMAHVPLPNNQIDVGVFCLALMGTNLSDFICEANRVIKKNGVLLVAEVISRFEKVGSFIQKMAKLGFTLVNKDTSNKMFIWFEFKKTGHPIKDHIPEIHLAPCIYKRR